MAFNRYDAYCHLEGDTGSAMIYIDGDLTILATLYDLDGVGCGNPLAPDVHNFLRFQTDSSVELVFADAGDGYPQPIVTNTPPSANAGGGIWWGGNGAPSPILGAINDFYLDGVLGNVYQKISSGWTFIMCLVGPAASGVAWASVTGKPTFGTAAALNVGTGVGNVARGDCPAVTTSFIQALGAVIGHGCGDLFVNTAAAALPSMTQGDILIDTNS